MSETTTLKRESKVKRALERERPFKRAVITVELNSCLKSPRESNQCWEMLLHKKKVEERRE